MPMVYTDTLAAAGLLATNATPNTETDAIYFKAGARNAALQAVYIIGRAAALTSISGIAFRIVKFMTGSTSGASAAIIAKDPGMQAATHTAFTGGTVGTTRTQQAIFGCGAAPNPDSLIALQGSATNSLDIMSVSGTASLNYELSAEVQE